MRRLVELHIGADDADDIGRVADGLRRLGIESARGPRCVTAVEKATSVRATVEVAPGSPRHLCPPLLTTARPGRAEGCPCIGCAAHRAGPARKLGHAVLGTTDLAVTRAFFLDGLGFKVSDSMKDIGAFIRCSTDHHDVLVLQAPVGFLHHTSWEVDDIDEVGRGAAAMLEDHPERHIWGLGRHHAGSDFFWYLKDPAGNFSVYYSDVDCIVDDQLWTLETLEGAKGLFNWGPPPPPSFFSPPTISPRSRSRLVSCSPTSGLDVVHPPPLRRTHLCLLRLGRLRLSSPARTSSSWRAPATGTQGRALARRPEWAAGRWCDVFEIQDFLIQRCFIYLDPDYAGRDTARYPWLRRAEARDPGGASAGTPGLSQSDRASLTRAVPAPCSKRSPRRPRRRSKPSAKRRSPNSQQKKILLLLDHAHDGRIYFFQQ